VSGLTLTGPGFFVGRVWGTVGVNVGDVIICLTSQVCTIIMYGSNSVSFWNSFG